MQGCSPAGDDFAQDCRRNHSRTIPAFSWHITTLVAMLHKTFSSIICNLMVIDKNATSYMVELRGTEQVKGVSMHIQRIRTWSLLAIVVFFLFRPPTTDALSWVFTKIADSATTAAGQDITFLCFGQPSLKGRDVVFWGKYRNRHGHEVSGIYLYRGGMLSPVVDSTIHIPEGSGNFTYFSDYSFDGNAVAFIGYGENSHTGIYTNTGSALRLLAKKGTSVPDGSGNVITLFSNVSIDRETVAFSGTDDAMRGGIYTSEKGMLRIIAISGIAGHEEPLTPGFTDVAEVYLKNGLAAFTAYGKGRLNGIYADTLGSLYQVAGQNSPVEGTEAWNIANLSGPVSDGRKVAFKADLTNGTSVPEAICTVEGDSMRIAAMQGYTPVPEGIGTFIVFGEASIDSGSLAFQGFGNHGQRGIYTNIGGTLSAVVDTNTILDGKRPRSFLFKKGEGLSGRSVAFSVQFEDNTQAVYRADLICNGKACADGQ